MTTVDTVYTLSGTSQMQDITGNPVTGAATAVIDDYNGLVAVGSSWYAALNGGHNNSKNNKVQAIDLNQTSPKWALKNNGSTTTAFDDSLYNADGKPSSRHTCYNLQWVPQRNRIMAVTGFAVSGTGNTHSPYVDGYNVTTDTWDAQGTWATSPVYGYPNSCAVDPTTGNCFLSGAPQDTNTLYKWTQASNSWAKWAAWNTTSPVYGTPGGGYLVDWVNAPSTVDTLRNRLVGLIIGAGNHLQCLSLSTPTVVTVNMSADIVGSSNLYAGMVYDQDGDRYIIAVNGGIYSVHPTTGAVALLANITAGDHQYFTRIAYFRNLGCIAVLPTYASNIVIMPTRTSP